MYQTARFFSKSLAIAQNGSVAAFFFFPLIQFTDSVKNSTFGQFIKKLRHCSLYSGIFALNYFTFRRTSTRCVPAPSSSGRSLIEMVYSVKSLNVSSSIALS